MSKNRLDYQAQLSRHSHDISAAFSASQSTGMIVPQYFHILGPGDTIYYQSRMFARLQDVQNAFLGEIDLHLDAFFVPLQMLYTPFGQVFAQTDDFISSLFRNGFDGVDSFPLFSIDVTSDSMFNEESDYLSFESQARSTARLLNALDCNPLIVLDSVQQQNQGYQSTTAIDDLICHNPSVSPWVFAAYQCIYQKYFRNDEFERLNVSAYNFDSEYLTANYFTNFEFLKLRYVQRPKDYFTDVRVSPIASAVNQLTSNVNQFPTNGSNLSDTIKKVDSFLDQSFANYYTQGVNQNSVSGSSDSSSSFDSVSFGVRNLNGTNYGAPLLTASNVRALFAVDKFARIYGRADKTYDDQILAHFGIHIPHDVKHDITHLSHYRSVLMSDPVYSTSNIQNSDGDLISSLGQVGGQGSVDCKTSQDKFTAPVHGVFMIVAYFVTKPRYVFTFSKLHLLSNRLSFPIPEFDKLGAQPIYGFEVNPVFFQSDSMRGVRLGWQNRYNQFKEKYNRCSLTYYGGSYGHGNQNYNIYSPWVISRLPYSRDISTPGGNYPVTGYSQLVRPYALFESPFALDTIMVKKYVPEWSDEYFEHPHLMFQSDPIITDYFCSAKLVSWMSETGEPDL